MKKTVLPLLLLCVCIFCGVFMVAAGAETQCTIRIENVVCEPNAEVTMDIVIENNPLSALENVILTPHIGGLSYESFHTMMKDAIDNIVAFDREEYDRIIDKQLL